MKQVSVGQHILFLNSSGYAFGVGDAGVGQLGTGDTTQRSSPFLLAFRNFTDAAASNSHTIYLTASGDAWATGMNDRYQLGLGDTTNRNFPTFISSLRNISQVSAGLSFSVFLTFDGFVYSCGFNFNGNLGHGDTITRTLPKLISALNNTRIVQISAGGAVFSGFTMFLNASGSVFSCGSGFYGNTGHNDTIQRSTPQLITNPILTNVVSVVAGPSQTLFLTNQRKVYAVGENIAGNLGLGHTRSPVVTPELVQATYEYPADQVSVGQHKFSIFLSDGKSYYFGDLNVHTSPETIYSLEGNNLELKAGFQHNMVVDKQGGIYGFGYNDFGQVITGDTLTRFVPEKVQLSSPVRSVGVGDGFTVLVLTNGSAFGVGLNGQGQLGLGDTTIRSSLTRIGTFSNYTGAATGQLYTLLLTSGGDVYSFGFGTNGQLGHGDIFGRNRPTLITKWNSTMNATKSWCGTDQSFVLNSTGELYAFGNNFAGRLGVGDTTNRFIPTLVPLKNVTHMSISATHTLFLIFDGSVYVCGENGFRQHGMLDNLVRYSPALIWFVANVTSIAAGTGASFFVMKNRAWAVGLNADGQLGLGDIFTRNSPVQLPLLNVVQVSASSNYGYTLFLTSCPEGTSGQGCRFPTCFNQSGADLRWTCSGQGNCSSLNTCSCYSSTSSGPQCEINEYHWKGFPGKWSDVQNWYIQRGSKLIDAIQPPSAEMDAVYFDVTGSYEPIVDVNNIKLAVLSIGGIGANVNLKFNDNSMITISSLFEVKAGSVTDCSNCNVKVQGSSSFGGKSTWSRGITYHGNLMVPGTGSFQFETLFSQTSGNMQVVGDFSAKYAASISLTMVTATIGSSSDFQRLTLIDSSVIINGKVSVTSLSTYNSRIEVLGTLTMLGTSSALLGVQTLTQTALIIKKGVYRQIGSNSISFVDSPPVQNEGIMSFESGTSMFDASIVNLKNFSLSNSDLVIQSLAQLPGSSASLNFRNGTLSVRDGMNVTGGDISLSGTITTSLISISSSEGLFRIPSRLNVIGNMFIGTNTTLIVNMYGANDMNSLNVTGNLVMNPFVILNLANGFNPQIDSKIQFLTYGSLVQASTQNIYLVGAPFKNAKYSNDGSTGSFQIIFSFGSVTNLGYQCTYLGNKKNLEINRFDSQSKVILSITTPYREAALIGFGFDLNGTFSRSIMSLSYQNAFITQWNHNSSLPNPLFVTASATKSKTIFGSYTGQGIGPDYLTITLLFPSNFIESQKYIYYAEILASYDVNGTVIIPSNTSVPHYFERYEFSILSSSTVNCTNFLQPQRVEIYSIAATVLILLLYVVTFVLCLVFARYRPLNTRGISPFLTLFFLFTQLLLEIRNYFEISNDQASLCFYYSFAMYPLQQICFIMILLYFLRYFAIINLNGTKNNIYTEIQSNPTILKLQKYKLLILKLLTSTWITSSLVIVSYLLLSFLFLIVLAGWGFVCQFSTLLTIKTIHNVELIIIYALTLFSLIGDMIPNLKSLFIKCRWIDYIFRQDPYWFRAQIVLFIPFMIFSLIIEIYTLAVTSDYLGVVSKFQDTIILNTVQAAILYVIDVLFPLILTMIDWILSLRQKRETSEGTSRILDHVLSNHDLAIMFADFCKSEYSIENLACYTDLIAFQKKPQGAQELYDRYFCGATALMEVNCPRSTCNGVLAKIQSGQIDETVFAPLLRDVIMNLSDTMMRFRHSEQYIKFVKNTHTNIQLIEGRSEITVAVKL